MHSNPETKQSTERHLTGQALIFLFIPLYNLQKQKLHPGFADFWIFRLIRPSTHDLFSRAWTVEP